MPSLSVPTRAQIAFSLVIGSIAVLIVGVQPILLGALVDTHRITMDGVGLLAMSEIITLGLGVLIGDFLPVQHFRSITIGAAVLTAGFDVVTAISATSAGLLGSRALGGLSEGVLVWASTCVIVRSAAPERIAGTFMVLQTLGQAGVAALLASVVVLRAGWQGGFLVLAALSMLAAALAFSQPVRLAPLAKGGVERLTLSASAALTLTVIFLEQAAIGALWAYLEPLGQAVGLTALTSQTVVSVVLCAQLAGGCLGTLLVKRVGPVLGLTASCAVLACIPLGVRALAPGGALHFTLLAALFGFAWVFSFPFQIGLAFNADPAGRIAMLTPALQLLGSAFGPLVASMMVSDDNARPATLASAAFGILATLLLLGCRRWFSRPVAERHDAEVVAPN
ncbi:MFS transporter [Burkholderia vietnamiensis]|uniref:MFS transporter n=1 Tax=Burkholderia vietnamiensis TaxID=60552 RepID=UPI001B8F03EA|nr:MFS transporter [Burkholderia vietnamiensis]MBR8203363.1 MFS transporter [Burkholderia vietnamiensis]MBR8282554.1 MFS transporter [Burkholderia vietnamiensis]